MNRSKELKDNKQNRVIDGGFLQSGYWRKFQESLGNEVFNKRCKDGSFLAIKQNLPLGFNYLLVSRGPVLRTSQKSKVKSQKQDEQSLAFRAKRSEQKAGLLAKSDAKKENKYQGKILLSNSLIQLADKNGVGWIKIEPQTKSDLEFIKNEVERINKERDQNYKIIKSNKEHQPRQTLMVNLEPKEDEIIGSFKSKTRYNVRISKRKGVEVVETRSEEDIEKFLNLLDETAERDGIKNHSREHYRKLILTGEDSVKNFQEVKLYLAKYRNNILAGAIVAYSGKIATYFHGASSNKKRNLMAPFGLHWEIMKQAKVAGYEKYDLGGTKLVVKSVKSIKSKVESSGVQEEVVFRGGAEQWERWDLEEHKAIKFEMQEEANWIPADGPWQGITRFKLGFCPKCQPTEFPGGYDIVINEWKYKLYRLIQKIK